MSTGQCVNSDGNPEGGDNMPEYFSHDYHAASDVNIIRIRSKHGWLGYGIYWALVEALYGNGGRFAADYDALAFLLQVDKAMIQDIIENYDVFYVENGEFGSKSVDRRITERIARTANAKFAADSRWNNADAMQMQCGRNADALQPLCDRNAIKEKKRKEKNINYFRDSANHATQSPQDCPHKEIIELYHKHLPMLPRVIDWTAARRAFMQSRWRENKERQSLDWWDGFFQYVAQSDFLCGRTKEPFKCNLEWLIRPRNFVKVIEGNYENAGGKNGIYRR